MAVCGGSFADVGRDAGYRSVPAFTTVLAVLGDLNNHDDFNRAWDVHFLRSVYAATSAAYERTAGGTPEMAYVALAVELRDRGIEPDREAIYTAAMLISRGEQPAILRQGNGRHRARGSTRI